MKSSFPLVAIVTFCVSFLIISLSPAETRSFARTHETEYMESLKDSHNFHFFVSKDAKKVFKISGTYFNEKNMSKLFKEEWFRGEEFVRRQLKNFRKSWPGREALFLIVSSPPMTVGAWKPEEYLAFEQDFVYYEARPDDIVPLSKAFKGGEVLDSFSYEYGYVIIPERIDITRSFKIWYGRFSYASGYAVVDSKE